MSTWRLADLGRLSRPRRPVWASIGQIRPGVVFTEGAATDMKFGAALSDHPED